MTNTTFCSPASSFSSFINLIHSFISIWKKRKITFYLFCHSDQNVISYFAAKTKGQKENTNKYQKLLKRRKNTALSNEMKYNATNKTIHNVFLSLFRSLSLFNLLLFGMML